MSIGTICIFDPAIFDPAIFTCCNPGGAVVGGAADGVEDWIRRKEREEEELERSNILRKRRYNEWKIAKEQSNKLAKKIEIPVVKPKEDKKTLILPTTQLVDKAAKKVSESVIYRIYQEAEKQKIEELIRKQNILQDEAEAILLLLGD